MTDENEPISFETALEKLTEIVAQLEAGELTLEQSLSLFAEGQKLADYCNEQLETAVLRVEQLTADGEIIARTQS